MAGRLAEVNSNVLLCKTLWDGNTGKGVRARVFNSSGAEVSGSPFTLTHRSNGHYSGSGWNPTAEGQYSVSYEIYTTVGFATADRAYEWDDEEIEVRSIDQDLATLLTRLGVPVSTIAGDIAGVQADTNDIQAKIGTPAGVSVSADIAAVKAETASIQADTNDIQAKIGTPVSTLAGDIAGVQADTNDIQSKIGTPAGASISVDIAAVKAETASIQADTNDIQAKIGTPAGVSVSADIAAVKSDTGTILGQTGTTGVQIANGAITAAKFAANAIDANAIADNAIDAGAIAAGAITSAKFAAGAIDANAIADNAIDAGAIAAGALTSAKFAAGAIDANAIAAGAITAAKFAASAIDANAIATGAITAAKFAANAINAAALASDAAVEIAAAVWDQPLASHVTAGSMGFNQNLVDDIEADTASLNDTKITTARANNLDNLDATVSSRATAVQTSSILSGVSDIQAKIGTPVTTLAADIAGVQSDTNDIQSKIGSPVATLATDIAGVQSTANAVNTKIGTPSVSVSADIAAVYNRIGAPVGASISADIASVKATALSIETKVDDLSSASDSSLSIPETFLVPTSGTNVYRIYWRHFTTGVPSDPASGPDIEIQRSNGTDIISSTAMTKETDGVFYYDYSVADTAETGLQVLVKVTYKNDLMGPDFLAIATANQSSSDSVIEDILTILGTPETGSIASDIDRVYLNQETIELALGTPDVTFADDLRAVKSDTAAIKTKTDQLSFTGGNVHARAQVVADKTGYALSSIDKDALVDLVWDEDITAHSVPDSSAVNLLAAAAGDVSASSVSDIADAVWDNVRSSHNAVGTFGEALQGVLSATRANNLDDLDVAVSSRASQASLDALQGTADTIDTKIGTPAGVSLSADVAAVKADTAAILDDTGTNGVLLSPAAEAQLVDAVWDELQAGHSAAGSFGKRLDVDVSTRQAESDALTRFNDLTADIAGVQADTDDIQSKIGTPVSTVSADIAAVKAVADSTATNVTSIKAQTDQLTFTGSNVNANAQVVSDKTDYALSSASRAAVVDEVWDEPLSAHTAPGSTGEALGSLTASTPSGIAAAVWDALVAPHNVPNTFGNYVQVIRQSALSTLAELNSPSYGLSQIFGAIGNSELAVIAEVNQNETKIDAIIPYVNSQTVLLKGEIDQNQILIEALGTQLSGTESTIMSEFTVVENKIDSLSAQVGTIQNNTTTRFVVPERLIKPASGSKTYQFHLRLYDETGHAQAPDSAPTIRIRRLDTGIDVVAGAAMTPDGVKVGAYYYDFTITAGTDEYQALVEATVIENGATRYVPAVTEITEFESDLNQIQAQLTSVQGTVVNTNLAVNSGVYGLAALKSGQTNIVSEIDQNQVLIQQVKAKTDLLPASPASTSDVAAVNATVLTRPTLADITTEINLARDYIVGPDNRNITAVYDKIDFTTIMKTNDPRLNYLDANVSSRSTLAAADVWSFGTRELTNFTLPVASVKAIWDYLASQATTVGSLGKLLADNLDAKVSTRATAAQVTAALAGVAQESTVSSLAGIITSGDNQTQIQLAAVAGDVSQIKAKTQNLPSDPVSASVVTGGFSSQAISLANLDLKATGIKAKTDNLPPDPAKETSVQARPTNPALASDIRLTRLDVAVSTRGTLQPADLAGLATAAGLASTQTALTTEINQNEVKIDNVQATANFIKAKTDNLPTQPVSKTQLDAAVVEIINEIDSECSGGGGSSLTAADVWSYPNRTITQDPQSFGPDISNLATKQDVADITINTSVCRMSTTLNSTDETHEVIVWLEKNGVPVTGASNARVKVMTTEGNTVWNATAATPNLDGVFSFIMSAMPPDADRSYYVEMTISDGTTDHVGRAAFITVG